MQQPKKKEKFKIIATSSAWVEVFPSAREHPFSAEEKISFEQENNILQPYDVFSLIVTDDLIDMIVLQTNKYATDYINNSTVTRSSRVKSWTLINNAEMKNFLGRIMCISHVKMPEIHLYWSTAEHYKYTFISKCMSRDRFQLLLKFLHFSDNSLNINNDRLFKVRPLLDAFVQKFQELYTPGSAVVIDEFLIPFRGCLNFKQYIPGKSHKYGCKLYKLCSPNSYTWNIQVYVGKCENVASFGHAESKVIQLANDLLGCGRTIFGDNFYSSVPLVQHLLEKKTYYCGTLRKDRKFVPKDVTGAKLKRGNMVSKRNSNKIKVYNWKDKRNVYMLSSVPEHSGELKNTGKKNLIWC